MADNNDTGGNPICIGKGCTKQAFARGMCQTHYSRWRIHGDCEAFHGHRRLGKCAVDGCNRKAHTRWKKGKAVCNKHWQMLYRYGIESPPPHAPPDPLPLCSVHKCKDVVRSRNAGYCEKHYTRIRRGKRPDNERAPLYRYVTGAGYVVIHMPGHPLAMKDGNVLEHRAVAYEANGSRCPNCYWCGLPLDWSGAVIDHLDENKSNNEPANLVVTCNSCNRARGAMKPFIASVREASWERLIDTLRHMRD